MREENNNQLTSSRRVGMRDINALLQTISRIKTLRDDEGRGKNVGQALPDNKDRLTTFSASPLEGEDVRRTKEGASNKLGCITPLPASGHPLPQGARRTSKAFTLIELLVVVLIIGILAAVALPQYRLAVARSRYATIKDLTNSIAQAEELYHLANGSYTSKFADLDLDMPSGKLPASTSWKYIYDWGKCWTVMSDPWYSVTCEQGDTSVAYRRPLHFSRNPNPACMIFGTTDLSDWRNKICALETHGIPELSTKYKQILWRYN